LISLDVFTFLIPWLVAQVFAMDVGVDGLRFGENVVVAVDCAD
jgi:hypothetical protein